MVLLNQIDKLEEELRELSQDCACIEYTLAIQYCKSIQEWVIKAQEKGEK